MSRVLARAHSQFVVPLQRGANVGEETVSQDAEEAVALLVAVAGVWSGREAGAVDRRAWLADQLCRWLVAHEDAVLAGEVTYCGGLSMATSHRPRSARRSRACPGMAPHLTAICCHCRSGPLTWHRC